MSESIIKSYPEWYVGWYVHMSKAISPLSAKSVESLKKPGAHAVGGVPGLCIQNTARNGHLSRSWLFRYSLSGKRSNMGLGPYPAVSLQDARKKANKVRELVLEGIDPKVHRNAQKSASQAASAMQKTFRECAELFMQSNLYQHNNLKHRKQWGSTLETYVFPIIGELLISDITTAHVINVLNQKTTNKVTGKTGVFWRTKTETATRIRQRIEKIWAWARTAGYCSGQNPAEWKNHLDTQLPKPSKVAIVQHHDAMHYDDINSFLQQLRKETAISAKALEFLILTGTRSKSVRLAEWSEIDLSKTIWTVPADHTKTKRENHRVPLSPQAISLLKALPRIADQELIFPSPRSNTPLTDSTISKLMREMREVGKFKAPGVPHGFRSSFRDWAAEQTNYPYEVCELAIMHSVGSSVQKAYQRSDMLEKRRKLMKEWADYLDRPKLGRAGNVLKLRRKS